MLTTIDELFLLTEQLSIIVVWRNLQLINPSFLGMADASKNTITLDLSLDDCPRKCKCVLAEEIGHILYPPRPGHIRYHSRGYWQVDHHDRSLMDVIVAQDERKALNWATGVLMPDDKMPMARMEGARTLPLLAEYFDVELWIVRLKIGYMRRRGRDKGIKYKWTDFIDRE